MVQGHPVKEKEQRKILEFHEMGYFPSQIAAHLSKNYPEMNGGSRSTETVKDTIKMLEKRKEMMGSYFPAEELPDLSPSGEPQPPQDDVPVKKLPDLRKTNGRKKRP